MRAALSEERMLIGGAREPSSSGATYRTIKPVTEGTLGGTVCGPLISERQRTRVERYVRLAQDEGGSTVVGGGRPVDKEKGFFVEPALVVGRGSDLETTSMAEPT